MKKVMFACMVALLTLGSNFGTTYAQNLNQHDSKGQEQAFDQLLLSLYNEQISNAVANHYKNDSIHFQFDWWNKNYDVVEVDQTEKGHRLQSPFVVKFTVIPAKKDGTQLGTDTIILGIAPDVEDSKQTDVKLLNYVHRDPPKK